MPTTPGAPIFDDIRVRRGTDVSLVIQIWNDVARTTKFNLTGYTPAMVITALGLNPIVYTPTIIVNGTATDGQLLLTMPAADTGNGAVVPPVGTFKITLTKTGANALAQQARFTCL